jgi:xanthine dehydrogenase accessory factor
MEPTVTPQGNMKSIALEIQRLIDEEENGVLALVIRSVGSAPGRVGAKMVVLADGSIRGTVGGGVVEARVIADSLNALEDGKGPRNVHYRLDELGMSCGGEMSLYLEPLQAPKRIVIYGGGHVAAAVAKVIKILGCRVTVVDEREEWANPERFPDADQIVNRPFAEDLTVNPPGKKDHVLIVTRGHDQDQLVLDAVVEKDPAYLGMIGSQKKARKAKEMLRKRKVSEERIGAVRSPVGLEIGAVTPEEIAVSIAADLVKFWRKGSSGTRPVKAPPLKPLGKVKEASEETSKDDLVFDDEEDDDK